MNATTKTILAGLVALFVFSAYSAAADAKKAAKEAVPAPAQEEAKPAEQAKPADAGGPAVDAVKAEIKERSKTSGSLDIFDSKTEKVRTLDMMSLSDAGSGKVTGEFRDTKTGDVVTVETMVTDGKVGDFTIVKAEPPKPVQQAKKDYTDQEIQDFMKEYIDTQSAGTGVYLLFDEKKKDMRKLEFVKLQEKVRRFGIIGISTAEFKEKDTGNTLLVDLNVENKKNGLEMTGVRIKSEVKGQGSATAAADKPNETATK